ncbi:MAG: cupin domain-containing protein, partial [Candidatus Thermoplasmatota archaeon]|nr:cupin domain-containing protein [Candidatus Thermoplasmatota archaeon]
TDNLVMIPLKVHWNDIDDFSDLYYELPKDTKRNVSIFGELLSAESENNLVIANKHKLISLINLNDMIVVDTDDVLFIAPRKESKHVKEIVKYLKEKKDERIINGLTVYRPWGLYRILEATEKRVIKKIRVFPKNAISLQLHHHRSEHWVVVNGTAKVYVNGKETIVKQGESTFIKPEQKHRLTNHSETDPLEIIEVQLGDIVSEEDIVRFEDIYGRV